MSGMPKLEAASISLSSVREHAKRELMAALDGIERSSPSENIAMVLDPSLSGPLGLVAEVREFREHHVEHIYHLLDEPLDTECERVAYFVRADLSTTERLARQVRQLQQSGATSAARPSISVFFVPRRSLICEKVLEEEGVYDALELKEFALHLIPLDDDLLSLEQDCFRELFLDGEPSVLHTVAASILKLEAMFGPIPSIRGKGRCAQQVQQMLTQMRLSVASDGMLEDPASGSAAEAPQIDMLLLIDRDVDLVTPLCTELTYEGLINQVFGISHGYVDLDPEILGQTSSRMVKRELNSNDPLYAKIRDMHFGDLGSLLHKLARGVHEGYEERHAAHTVSQIREFMRKLNKLQHTHKSLAMHVNIAERIQKLTKSEDFHKRIESEQMALSTGSCSSETEAYIEDMIARDEPLLTVLRLLCLQSLCSNGLKARSLASMQAELLHAYGYEQIAQTLTALHNLGLLRKQEGRNAWLALKKGLQLVVEDLPEVELGEDPPELAYTYSGYAPLSVRLVQCMVQSSWISRREALAVLPGPLFAIDEERKRPQQEGQAAGEPALTARPQGAASLPASMLLPTPQAAAHERHPAGGVDDAPSKGPVTLVYFIGGCTFSEISGVRWLRRHAKPSRDYIVATTHISTGDSLMGSLVHTLDNQLLDLEL